MQLMVYHGTDCEIRQPKVIRAKRTKDFGLGFYCTTIYGQAKRWAMRYKTPMVNLYCATLTEDLNVLEFPSTTEEWLDFIVACRNGKEHPYDVVIGPMADDQIYNYINEFISGRISRDVFWALIRFNYPTHQIAFCTKKALNCLKYVRCEVIYR